VIPLQIDRIRVIYLYSVYRLGVLGRSAALAIHTINYYNNIIFLSAPPTHSRDIIQTHTHSTCVHVTLCGPIMRWHTYRTQGLRTRHTVSHTCNGHTHTHSREVRFHLGMKNNTIRTGPACCVIEFSRPDPKYAIIWYLYVSTRSSTVFRPSYRLGNVPAHCSPYGFYESAHMSRDGCDVNISRCLQCRSW